MQEPFHADVEVPKKIVPLAERILAMVANTPQWDFKVVKAFFPTEHEKALYRALGQLEKDGKIAYLGWRGRTKQYTTMGVSNLPKLRLSSGASVDIKTMFPVIQTQYKDGRWETLQAINEIPITIGQLFILAQLDDDKALLENYRALIIKLNDYKRTLQTIMGFVDSIQSHPIMSGDLKLFKNVLNGDSPTQEEMTAFKVWLSRFHRGEFTNED
jgi:hypothetical protein